MKSTRSRGRAAVALTAMLLCSAAQPPTARPADSVVPREKLEVYLERLAAVPPRDAAAYARLGAWCQGQGLEAAARSAFELAVAIDTDCTAARAALGYERYGTGWRLAAGAGEATRVPVSDGAPLGDSEASETAAASARADSRTSAEELTAEQLSSALERKKAWAAEAAEKFGIGFSAYEDSDFLIHSTLERRDRNFKALLSHLETLERNIRALLGARARTALWPEKLHLVLLRSEPEYERFRAHIDAVDAAQSARDAYTRDGHTVLWRPDSEALPELLGRAAARGVYGSDRRVGWWLEEGIAQFVLAGSPWGLNEKYSERAFIAAADILREATQNARIFELLETRASGTERASRENAALTLTLIQFLVKRTRRGFSEFIRELKSEAAPRESTAGEGADEHLMNYIAFQEKAIEAHFGMSVPTLGEQWKAHVLRTGDQVRSQMERWERERQAAERRARSSYPRRP